jgi:hypothetical protein
MRIKTFKSRHQSIYPARLHQDTSETHAENNHEACRSQACTRTKHAQDRNKTCRQTWKMYLKILGVGPIINSTYFGPSSKKVKNFSCTFSSSSGTNSKTCRWSFWICIDLICVYWFSYRNRCKPYLVYISGLPLEPLHDENVPKKFFTFFEEGPK